MVTDMAIDKDLEKRNNQKDHFNYIAEDYINIRNSNKSHLYYKKILWEYFFYINKIKVNKIDLLEPMCGYGEGYNIIKNFSQIKINSYYGFDYSEKIVNFCKKNKKNLKIKFLDIINFKEKDIYNFAILIGGLHHVHQDVDLAINNICNSIKGGGYIINFEPTFELKVIEKIRAVIYKKNNFFDENTEKDFNLNELNKKFEKNNLKLVMNVRVGYFAYIFFYNPDAFPIISFLPKVFVKFFFFIDKIISNIKYLNKCSFATISLYRK